MKRLLCLSRWICKCWPITIKYYFVLRVSRSSCDRSFCFRAGPHIGCFEIFRAARQRKSSQNVWRTWRYCKQRKNRARVSASESAVIEDKMLETWWAVSSLSIISKGPWIVFNNTIFFLFPLDTNYRCFFVWNWPTRSEEWMRKT